MVKWLTSDNKEEYEDLPWAKDWLKSQGNSDSTHEVLSGFITDKGLLLQTGEFKTFLFKNSQDYRIVMEAITFWVDDAIYVHPLVVQVRGKGKVCFGIDDDRPKVIWKIDENRIDSIREESPLKAKSNPLLQATVPVLPVVSGTVTEKPTTTTAKKFNGRRPQEAGSPDNPT